MTKEKDNLIKAIEAYVKKHKGNAQFIGSFCAFKGKDFDVVDDLIIAFGFKDMLRDDLKNLDEEVEKEKEDFVNW